MSKSMEARGWLLVLSLVAWCCVAADYRTRNFIVHAPTPEIAKQVGDTAEIYRRDLAVEWLGGALRPWYAPCPIQVKVGQIGAGGQTSFQFEPNAEGEMQVYNWNMSIQGSLERILDSVLPHEITHTILACHFRCPLPRWADEGAATLAEHESEKRRQVLTVRQVLNTQHRIPLRKLVGIRDYPKDMRDVLTLYAEGYSVAELLVQKGGKARYLKFLHDALKKGWDPAFQKHYGYKSVEQFEQTWHSWVIAGSPEQPANDGVVVVRNDAPGFVKKVRDRSLILRGQAPEDVAGGTTATITSNVRPSRERSEMTAPVPNRNGTSRIRRLPTSISSGNPAPQSALAGIAMLGEEDSEDAPQPSASSSSKDAERTGELESTPEKEGLPVNANPGWSGVDESPNAKSSAAVDVEHAHTPRRKRPARDEIDESDRAPVATGDVARETRTTRTSDGYEAEPERRISRNAAALRSTRKRTPQWSEFPQISRPNPFVEGTGK